MRTTNGPAHTQKRNKVMKRASGFTHGRSKQYRRAMETIKKAERNAFVDRKQKKREFRKLWITRINIASRAQGLSYNRLIAGLNAADIRINRKQLSELAVNDIETFNQIVEKAKAAIA
jgi:large subunit ribosomal protein L20